MEIRKIQFHFYQSRRLSIACESRAHENQVGFRSNRGSVDDIFTRTCPGPTFPVRAHLWQSNNEVSQKFNLLYITSQNWACANEMFHEDHQEQCWSELPQLQICNWDYYDHNTILAKAGLPISAQQGDCLTSFMQAVLSFYVKLESRKCFPTVSARVQWFLRWVQRRYVKYCQRIRLERKRVFPSNCRDRVTQECCHLSKWKYTW